MKPSSNLNNPPAYTSKAFEVIRSRNASLRESLGNFTRIKDMPPGEPWDLIKALYSQTDVDSHVIAMILNGVATERRTTFFLSKDLLSKYINLDPNLSRGDLSGTVYKNLVGVLVRARVGDSLLRCLMEPSKGRSNERRAGVYTLANPEITKLFQWWPSEPVTLPESKIEALKSQHLSQRLSEHLSQQKSQQMSQRLSPETETEAESDSEINYAAPESETHGLQEYLEELAKLERIIAGGNDPECEHDLLARYFRKVRTPGDFKKLSRDSIKVRCAIIIAKERRILPPGYREWGKSRNWNQKAVATFGQDLDQYLFAILKLERET